MFRITAVEVKVFFGLVQLVEVMIGKIVIVPTVVLLLVAPQRFEHFPLKRVHLFVELVLVLLVIFVVIVVVLLVVLFLVLILFLVVAFLVSVGLLRHHLVLAQIRTARHHIIVYF